MKKPIAELLQAVVLRVGDVDKTVLVHDDAADVDRAVRSDQGDMIGVAGREDTVDEPNGLASGRIDRHAPARYFVEAAQIAEMLEYPTLFVAVYAPE